MNRYVIKICYFIAIGLIAICLMAAAKADQRLDLFMQQYENTAGKRLPLAHPDNPFYPYLDKHFEEGLDDKDRAVLARKQEKGDCWRIELLLIKGFVQLYPFLKPAFVDETHGNNIKFMISARYGPPSSHCFAHKLLNEISARSNLEDFSPVDMELEIMLKQKRRRDRLPETDRDIVSGIQFRLGVAAFCGDYPPSIKDIMATANKPGGMILTKDEELYLAQRALFHGLYKNSKYRQVIEKVMQGSQPSDHFNDIIAASRQFRLYEFEAVTGFWQPACKELSEVHGHL